MAEKSKMNTMLFFKDDIRISNAIIIPERNVKIFPLIRVHAKPKNMHLR